MKLNISKLIALLSVTVTLLVSPQGLKAQFASQTYYNSSLSLADGLYRLNVNSSGFAIDKNTSSDGSFGMLTHVMITTAGYVSIPSMPLGIGGAPVTGTLDVFGSGPISANFRFTGGSSGGYTRYYDTSNSAAVGFIGTGSNTCGGCAVTDFAVVAGTGNALKLGTNGVTVALTVDTAQQSIFSNAVAIGTNATPIAALDVLPAASTPTAAVFRGNDSGGGYISIYDNPNSIYRGFLGYGPDLFSGSSISDFGIRSDSAMLFSTAGGTVAMKIDNSQRVGIGLAPVNTAILVTNGNIQNNSAADASPYTQKRIAVYDDGVNWGYLGYGADAQMRLVFGKAGGGQINFGTSSATNNTGTFTAFVAMNETTLSMNAGVSLSWNSDLYLSRGAANVLRQQNSTNAQEFQVWGTTSGSKYLSLSHNGTDGAINTSSGGLTLATASGNIGFTPSTDLSYFADGTNSQEVRIYGTTTGPKYLSIGHNGSNGFVNAGSDSISLQGGGVVISPTTTHYTQFIDGTTPQDIRVYGSGSIYTSLGHDGTNGNLVASSGALNVSPNNSLKWVFASDGGLWYTGTTGSSTGAGTINVSTGYDIGGNPAIAIQSGDNKFGGNGNAIIRGNEATPGTTPGTGDWWTQCTGTSPSRTCTLRIRDGGADRILATVTF